MANNAFTDASQRTGIFSGQTETILNVVSVGTTAITVCSGNPNRLGLIMVNLSANSIYFSPIGIASSSNGILLSANGGSASLKRRDDFDLTGYSLSGLATGASSNLLVIEVNARVPIKEISFI